jgi:gliding motility-associated-like protein
MQFNTTLKKFGLALALPLVSWSVSAQVIDIGPPDTSVCTGTGLTLTVVYAGAGGASGVVPTQVSLTDDSFTGVIDIGFPFTFYGNTYTQCLISSNDYITFDLTNAGGYSPWGISAAIPSAADPVNSIMCPWQDINPGLGGAISYATVGTAPNRIFVVSYYEVPMFSCTDLCFTNQIKLFEGTNVIETHIESKPLCPTWNGGAAIHGLQNATGTAATVVTGRNFPTQWTATNDGYQFTPSGTGYATAAIPYQPSPMGIPNQGITWTSGTATGPQIGTGVTITVNPTTDIMYYATLTSTCTGSQYTDSIMVYLGNTQISTTEEDASCFGYSDGWSRVDPVGSLLPVTISVIDNPTGAVLQNHNNVMGIDTIHGLAAGTYDITVTDQVGCPTTLTVTINEPTPINPNADHYDILCAGEVNGRAFASPSGSVPPYTLQWNDPFQQTTDTIGFLAVGAYTVTVTDSQGCLADTTVIVSQPPPLVINMTAGPDTCENKNGAVTAWITGGTHPYVYNWSAISDSTHLFVIPQPGAHGTNAGLSQGEYEVLVTDSNGCEIEGKGVVELIPSPVAQFMTRSKPEEFTKPEVQFVNESTGSVSWEWRFGDGQESNEEEPLHIYDYDGSYLVMLAAFNDPRYGCADTTWEYVEVDPYMTFYVPNAFTPEGNGVNDTWGPAGTNFQLESYNVKLYDRWGKLIWQTDNPKMRWDGKDRDSGTPMMAGNYTYIFTLKRKNTFEPKVISGTVTLYRKQY